MQEVAVMTRSLRARALDMLCGNAVRHVVTEVEERGWSLAATSLARGYLLNPPTTFKENPCLPNWVGMLNVYTTDKLD